MIGLSVVTNSNGFAMLLVFILPVIWLIGLIDVFSLRKKFILIENGNSSEEMIYKDIDEIKASNKKTITMALSIIPGAGHMYLGYQKKGLTIMGHFSLPYFSWDG